MSTRPITNALHLTLAITLSCLTGSATGPVTASSQTSLDGFIAALEGGWAGENNLTPFGQMPFAVVFETQDDGSLHSRSSLNSETYIDLRFSKDAAGRWILREEAAMEGMGSHGYTLEPTPGADGMHRWIHRERPGFLAIDIGLEDDTMIMAVTLRGSEHVRFELERLSEEEVAVLRRDLVTAAQTPPGDGNSIRDVVESFPTPDAGNAQSSSTDDQIASARRGVERSPYDAGAHLALAQALGAAISRDPANGPIYAGEMYRSLMRSIELDSHLSEAYHWLVGYYLNAPPIAGGSVAMAEETARRLAEFDAESARPLLEEIASRRAALQ